MAPRPAALARIGLDEIRQRNPKFDILVAERQQLITRPR